MTITCYNIPRRRKQAIVPRISVELNNEIVPCAQVKLLYKSIFVLYHLLLTSNIRVGIPRRTPGLILDVFFISHTNLLDDCLSQIKMQLLTMLLLLVLWLPPVNGFFNFEKTKGKTCYPRKIDSIPDTTPSTVSEPR